jgi:hypothetical protein
MADSNELKKGESNIGGLDNRFYCRVFIKDVEITPDQIMLLAIRSWIFEKAPRLELQFRDGGKFVSLFPLEDFDEIRVVIANEKKDVNFIDAKFRLHDYFINQEGGNRKTYLYGLTALLESKTFYFESKNRSFKNQNSSDVASTIATDSGFTPDIRKTSNDKMTWYQINATDSEMVDHILQRSYVQDNDTSFAYADVRSKFVFTSLKNELEKKTKLKAVYFSDDINPSDKKNPDDKDLKIKNFALKSLNGSFNKMMAYNSTVAFYDQEDSVTVEVTDDTHTLTTNSLKFKDNIKYNTDTHVLGMKTKNMHDEYFKAELLNVYERYNNFQVFTEVTFDMKNQPDSFLQDAEALNLFDVIEVEYVSNMTEKNKVYSGKYVVANITHQVNATGVYVMTLMLFRNGQNFEGSLLDDTKINVS